ncbi:hypothetical protein ONZ45_g19066 [Pleurotus djamor]|nr:hypothetical protein ONZ45_g19066 [Pleurotus djamor]
MPWHRASVQIDSETGVTLIRNLDGSLFRVFIETHDGMVSVYADVVELTLDIGPHELHSLTPLDGTIVTVSVPSPYPGHLARFRIEERQPTRFRVILHLAPSLAAKRTITSQALPRL